MAKNTINPQIGGMLTEPKALRKKYFAELVGVSPARVTHMIRQGLPVEADGRIDIARGKLWISENVDTARAAAQARRSTQADLLGGSYASSNAASEQTRLAKEKADTQELKNKQLRGELVAVADVERTWTAEWRELRSAILAVPSRLRQLLPLLKADDIEVIDAELRRVLMEKGNGG